MYGIKGKLGFGCMRLPMKDGEVDHERFSEMIEAYFAAGFNYFDTAHGYIDGKSETAIRECLTSRYPRESFLLTNKLSGYFDKEEDILPLFEKQLECSGTDYFDFYLMHAQGQGNYAKYRECRAYEISLELLKQGKIRHFGISYHDSAEFLEKILNDYPQIEVVQLQFNYIDFDDPDVEAGKCYEVCRKYGKSVLVMEPVKGGKLASLPEEAEKLLADVGTGSPASYALRFAAGFDGVISVLSGMGSMEMMEDNISTMTDPVPLTEGEKETLGKVCAVIRKKEDIPCTGCRYCVEKCPQGILIPEVFTFLNDRKDLWRKYKGEGTAPSECVKCGACEKACPQHLAIRELLKKA